MNQNATATLLERERARRGVNYSQLGEILGVSRWAARRYCLGERRPERGKAGKAGPAELLVQWSGGKIHAGNFDQPAPAPAKPRRRRAGT